MLVAAPAAGAAANAAATAAGSLSSQSSQSATPQSAAAAPGSQLMQALAADAKASASIPAPAAGASAAPPAATASAVTAALAGQLIAGPHVGAQQPMPDSRSMTLSSQVGSSAWTDELGAKVTWMAGQGIESASLQLSPEHLGPLQVNISVHDGQASVWFGAAQPDTRAALQQSLPQLRQLFANQGLTLTDAGVSRESPREQGRQASARGGAAVAAVATVSLDGSAGHAQVGSGLGLVDTYA